ncbi:hypothetical protein CA13_00710 [Planctomycetes bacterium CA13]|uniref:Uncharacterized protein n=1 Tax=Novipirellula herctigrandis TaxID=2527986 RepID=A0A5C5YUE7_9BACT|nr:hypothetical protein CA13_00040 [Planctomycetes bacterium CA13]TWT78675.1 hypothetical protein CA13_00710 [Planctomycetes bacterium CA13]
MRKPFQFRLASLLLLLAVSAITFAWIFSNEDLERSLRRDLEIAKSAQLEIVKDGTRKSPFQSDERYAWVLVKTKAKYELIGAVRPLDDSMPWRIPDMTISWIDDQVGPEPFYFVFSQRPKKPEIDSWIRYSNDFW